MDKREEGLHFATHYERINATGVWIKSEFKDYADQEFYSNHIRIKVTGGDLVSYSFDPRDVSDAERKVHGVLAANEVILLMDKHSDAIWVKRAGAVDSNVDIYAWR